MAVVFLVVTVGRTVVEGRRRLTQGMAAEAEGDVEGAYLAYGEARLWRLPGQLAPWVTEAERRLTTLPPGQSEALAGAPVRRDGRDPASQLPVRFGPPPDPRLATAGGLALLAALAAAFAWARSSRPRWAIATAVGGCLAALALGAA